MSEQGDLGLSGSNAILLIGGKVTKLLPAANEQGVYELRERGDCTGNVYLDPTRGSIVTRGTGKATQWFALCCVCCVICGKLLCATDTHTPRALSGTES